jgi:hypothetical protein
MLTKAKEFDRVREIFELSVNFKLSPKKMKFMKRQLLKQGLDWDWTGRLQNFLL